MLENKQISVIFRLENLSLLNGGLQIPALDNQFDLKIRTYLHDQFGKSAEKIEVVRRKDKIRLTWYLPVFVQEANSHHQKALGIRTRCRILYRKFWRGDQL